jgi:hypothetical protein
MSAITGSLSKEAIEICTEDQLEAICRLMADKHTITVHKAGFDLPDGYLTFILKYESGSTIYGGISPEGDVST